MKKRRLLAVSLPLFACLACVWPASPAVTAQVTRSIARLKVPDLVITEVRLTKMYRGKLGTPNPDAMQPTLRVSVKNTGDADAAPCALAVRYVPNLLDKQTWKTVTGVLPVPTPGATKSVELTLPWVPLAVGSPWQGMLIAAVDPAVAGKETGQVSELSGEFNNVFGFSLINVVTWGISWKNPPDAGGRSSPHADLVVTQVTVDEFYLKDIPGAKATVTVKNIGNAASVPCTLALYHTRNMADENDAGASATLPALAPGATTSRSFELWDIGFPSEGYWRGMLLAYVDPAVASHPSGQVSEGSGEFNNVFGFTFKAKSAPATWKNPAGS